MKVSNYIAAVICSGLLIANSANAQNWLTKGNSPTAPDTLGNKSNHGIHILTNNITRIYIAKTGEIGLGTTSPDHVLSVHGQSTSTYAPIAAVVDYTGNANVIAIHGTSTPGVGYGYGLYGTGGNTGVYGVSDGGNSGSFCYGVKGQSSGTAGTRIGIYGYAFGGNTNWAGYFSGNTYVSDKLCVGTTNAASGYLMSVNGKIICEELKVELKTNWPDYVFEKDHALMPLDKLEQQIEKDKHLPGIPSACEIESNGGLQVGEMQTKMMEKIEELTLYLIQLKKDNDELHSQMKELKKN